MTIYFAKCYRYLPCLISAIYWHAWKVSARYVRGVQSRPAHAQTDRETDGPSAKPLHHLVAANITAVAFVRGRGRLWSPGFCPALDWSRFSHAKIQGRRSNPKFCKQSRRNQTATGGGSAPPSRKFIHIWVQLFGKDFLYTDIFKWRNKNI